MPSHVPGLTTALVSDLAPFCAVDTATREQYHLNLILTALSGLSLLMCIVYFPNRPDESPSASAELAREEEENVRLENREIKEKQILLATTFQ